MAMSMTVTPSRYSRNAGVYRIVNTTNGRCYFGSAVNFHRRAITHVHALRNGNSHSKKLQAAWNKYGESSFKFEVVLVCARRDAVMYEQMERCEAIVRDGALISAVEAITGELN